MQSPVALLSFSRSVTSHYFATPRTIATWLLPFMGFSRQEYWRVWPFPSPGIFLTQGLNLCLLH